MICECFCKSLKLNCTSTGRYVLPLYKAPAMKNIEHVLINSNGSVKSMVLKIHRQFAHPSAYKPKELLDAAGK